MCWSGNLVPRKRGQPSVPGPAWLCKKHGWVIQSKQGNVLIIDEESGNERLSRRLAMAIRGELADDLIPIYYISLAQFNLFKEPGERT